MYVVPYRPVRPLYVLMARVLQGLKSKTRRERNGSKPGTTSKSTLKSNEAAKNIVCQTCRQSFVRPALSVSSTSSNVFLYFDSSSRPGLQLLKNMPLIDTARRWPSASPTSSLELSPALPRFPALSCRQHTWLFRRVIFGLKYRASHLKRNKVYRIGPR